MNAGRITGIIGLCIMALNIAGSAYIVATFMDYI